MVRHEAQHQKTCCGCEAGQARNGRRPVQCDCSVTHRDDSDHVVRPDVDDAQRCYFGK